MKKMNCLRNIIRREMCNDITNRWEYTRFRKKPKGGGRYLNDVADTFQYNAWDNVSWNEEQEEEALTAVLKNSTQKVPIEDRQRFQEDANKFWDSFYEIHQNRFFKDRHWLFTEFPELSEIRNKNETAEDDVADKKIKRNFFELGCGVGNTLLPILQYNKDPLLHLYGCDFSERAIEILRTHPQNEPERCTVFVMDASMERWQVPFEENSMDIIVLIFVLSAIEPKKMKNVAENCFRYLRPGGQLLFRDYGRYDLTQLRFKNGKCLDDNFYVRGDGTMVYFFTQEEVRNLFCSVGLVEEQNVADRRLQVNRGRMLKMYRVWIQTKFKKPLPLPAEIS